MVQILRNPAEKPSVTLKKKRVLKSLDIVGKSRNFNLFFALLLLLDFSLALLQFKIHILSDLTVVIVTLGSPAFEGYFPCVRTSKTGTLI